MTNKIQEELDRLRIYVDKNKKAHAVAMKKYQMTEKGKIANRKAQKKRYIPTGRPVGRPKKIQAN